MNNITVKKFKAPVYKTQIWIIVCKSVHKAIDHIEDLTDFTLANNEEKNSIHAYTVGIPSPEGKYQIFLFVPSNAKPGIIAHEAKHLVNMIFAWNGVKLSINNDEHECYYLEQMVDKIHNIIAIHNKGV